MPLDYQQNINGHCVVGVWRIEEPEAFFLEADISVPGINHPHKRLQHLAGRYLLKNLRPDFPLQEIEIHPAGKPFLASNHCWFSVSHCGDNAAAIVDEHIHVGVDIETMAPKIEKVMHKFLSPYELELLNASDLQVSAPTQQSLHLLPLTIAWSVKEAVFKWYGKAAVDFKKHMQLSSIQQSAQGFSGTCQFSLGMKRDLEFNGVIFNDKVLAWVRA